MNKIPTHKASEVFPGEMAVLRYVSDYDLLPEVDYAHRDDYYLFLFMEKGEGSFFVDFKEHRLSGTSIFCVLPGQVHLPVHLKHVCGWFLATDRMLVKDEYKEVFEKVAMLESVAKLDENTITDLRQCLSIINRRFDAANRHIGQTVIYSLISSYIGMIADIYQKGFPVSIDKRAAIITFQFQALLSANYKSFKRPAQYASLLHLSPVYLNEAVKKTTGLSVSDCIQHEIMLQAKRLLFYTGLSIKEIALKLGYEDWAYFSRLFTKTSELSPTQFRKKYLK